MIKFTLETLVVLLERECSCRLGFIPHPPTTGDGFVIPAGFLSFVRSLVLLIDSILLHSMCQLHIIIPLF